jgi:membrane protein
MVLRTAFQFLRTVSNAWSEAKVPRLGAALAYYSVFSLAPLVILAVSIAGLVLEGRAARAGVMKELERVMGPQAATAIGEYVQESGDRGGGWYGTAVGLVVLLFGASGVFIQLQDALNTIWKVSPRPGRTILNMIRDRFLSFLVVLMAGFLVLVSILTSTALTAAENSLTTWDLAGSIEAWRGVHWVVSIVFLMLLFGLIFKVLPDVRIAWRDVWIGAGVTAILFNLGKYLLGIYLTRSGVTSAFGAAASFVVILLWIYYSSQIVLFGAEFTRVWAMQYGSPVVPRRNAVWTNPA